MPGNSRKKAKAGHWPCAICCENCDYGSVQCNCCSKWVHVQCEGLNNSDLQFIYSFECRMCIRRDDGDSYSYNSALFRLRDVSTFL